MINREVTYERDMTASYMRIPAGIHAGLDEKLMLRRKLPGALPVERTYVDGSGQYWYNISGKQSLDMYCRVKEIGIDLVEHLIGSICSEIEILEWNLVQSGCLMLDPELIFLTGINQEVSFTIYPSNNTTIETEFQQLMEYLLTKINHKDEAAVRVAYAIYERTLEEGYSIPDVREVIRKAKYRETEGVDNLTGQKNWGSVRRGQDIGEGAEVNRQSRNEEYKIDTDRRTPGRAEKKQDERRQKTGKRGLQEGPVQRLWTFLQAQLGFEEKKAKEIECIVYPEEEIYVPEVEIHPTVCLGNLQSAPQGILLYQGAEQFPDIRLDRAVVRIGHGRDTDVQVNRDTVSQMHARILREGDSYYIEDLNSTNGTFVNDELLAYKEKRQLKVNDTVRLADLRYRFC